MLEDARARTVTVTRAAQMPSEELAGKIVTGILHEDPDAPEFQAAYAALSARAQQAEAAGRKGRPRRVPAPAAEPVACGLPPDLLTAGAAAEEGAGRKEAPGAGAIAEAEIAEEGRGETVRMIEDVLPPDGAALPCEGGE
jgi:hypothetical protein